MSWIGVITDAGREVYNQYSMSGVELNISSLKLGSGPVDSSHMRDKTALVGEKTSGVIESINVVQGGTQVMLRAGPAPSDVGAYTLKEMGVYVTVSTNGNDTDVLFAYCIETGDGIGIPSVSNFPDFVYILTTNLIVDNTVEMEVTIPPASFVSYLQFSSAMEQVNALLAGKKDNQTAVSDPEASGESFAFIDTISQGVDGKIVPTKKTIPVMIGATGVATGVKGLVPAPAAGKQTSFLRGDGTWVVPPDTTYNVMSGATGSAAGTAGLVPAPGAGKQTSFLRGDGTWVIPTNTTYSAGTGIVLNGTTFSLATSGVSAGSYGPTGDVSGTNNSTIKIPQITVDAYGRVTSIVNRTLTNKDTTYPVMTGATSSNAGAAGLVPAPAAGKNASYLRGDGVWAVPNDTQYSAGTGLNLSNRTFSLKTSGVTAGTYGPSGNVTGTEGSTINIPQITVDAYGRVTSVVNRVLTNKDTNTTYGNFNTSNQGLVPASGNNNNVLRGSGWSSLQTLLNDTHAQAYSVINGWEGKMQFRYGVISGVESKKDGTVWFSDWGGVFPNNCLHVSVVLKNKFEAAARVTVMSFDKNAFTYNVMSNNGSNLDFSFIAFGY